MNAFRIIREQIAKLGYSAIEKDYVFSDVFTPAGTDRVVPFVAFTNTPASYRNAAFAVVDALGRSASELTSSYRALGAPALSARFFVKKLNFPLALTPHLWHLQTSSYERTQRFVTQN